MHSPSRSTRWITLAAAFSTALTVAGAFEPRASARADAPTRPAEESRLSTGVFRAGLKKRGLTELLELHLKDFPPASKTEAMLMMREVKLAEFADPSQSRRQREAAIDEANRILEELIQANRDDPRRFEWRFTLGNSLLYDQAEPFFTSILYRGGSAADRRKLLSLSTRAVTALTALVADVAGEYKRVDRMSIREFERLEADGYIERLDHLAPRADYLLLWALFYDSLPRDDADPTRTRQLNNILERIAANPALLKTPHDRSRVQVQALLLAGMTCRLLNDHRLAREHLDRALAVAERLDDPDERKRVGWAVTLARLERIRNDRDDGRFEDALSYLARFHDAVAAESGGNFGLELIAALLERSVYRSRVAAAQRAGRASEAEQYRRRAWKELAQLGQRKPSRRDEIYATLYDMIGPGADPERLDPLEQCALIAGLLFDADQESEPRASARAESPPPERTNALLDRAVEVGERFLADPGPGGESLLPEVLYNVAVAEYRRGRQVAAAGRFLEVARDHPTFSNALPAATFAVQLGAELFGDPSLGGHPEVQRLYHDALEILITRHRDTDAARYWQFYYAQLLDELEDYDDAAVQYALVDHSHEHYVETVFARVRCLALVLQQHTLVRDSNLAPAQTPTRHQADDFFMVQREFVALVTRELNLEQNPARISTLRSLLARVRLIGAEVQVLPHVDQPARALATLAGFEEEFPDEQASAGRLWRVRLLAYEKLGRFDEAARAVPAYVAADPENAVATFQSLYLAMTADVERLQAEGDTSSAQRKADMALILARQIHEQAGGYVGRPDSLVGRALPAVTKPNGHALTVQLAEANLRAGRYERARELFEAVREPRHTSGLAPAVAPAGKKDEPAVDQQSSDLRVVLGHAESLFQLGEFTSALPEFNRLATSLPTSDPTRWKSLLRDLECRTALGHPPRDIIKVIEQQRHLYPDLGGPALAGQFEKLQRENERRADGR